MLYPTVKPENLDVYMALADTLIAELNPEDLRDKVPPTFPMDRLEEYCKLTPSRVPDFRNAICDSINNNGIDSSKKFLMVMSLLSSRIAAPILTSSTTLITDMSLEQKQDLLRSWRDSPLWPKRQLFRSIFSLTFATYQTLAGELHYLALRYPAGDKREFLTEDQKIDTFRYTMMDRVKSNGTELYLPNVDALIIGSGAGAGVTAHTLQNSGYNCLVLEKGKYYAPQDYNFDEFDGLKALYENNGKLATLNQEMFILAGSTFGGGTTVNWSACIKTPFKVRKEWYDDYGVDFVADEAYDNCLDYVFKQMGANHENINHSHSNKAILESAETLGYHASQVNQNNGTYKNHDCGHCYLGCKYGVKQGSQACWLRDAADKGCQFLDQVRVNKIIHKNGKAVAAECQDKTTGFNFRITGPKKFIVSSGSLQTPILLKNSGFKNKNIGSNLKLHPVIALSAYHDESKTVDPHSHPIMTAVSNQSVDLDGKAHGPKIETLLHAPFAETPFLPWDGGKDFRKELLRFNNMSAMLIITRDFGSGKVYADPRRPENCIVDYAMHKYDTNALQEGYLTAADMLYMYGAVEIVHPQNWIPKFKSRKPKHERSINDKDFQEWRQTVKKTGVCKYGLSYGSAHQMSSCRMSGKGPKYGAVDLKGRLFECKNIHVADASVLPTASGANPMISTMAMARHIALDLVQDLKSQPKL